MQIAKKTRDGIQSLPLDAMLLMQRKVFLTEAITSESINEIIKQLLRQGDGSFVLSSYSVRCTSPLISKSIIERAAR